MTDLLGDALNFTSTSTLSVADPPVVTTNPVADALTGIVMNQNQNVVTVLTDDVIFPTATIKVRSTVGFPSSGQVRIGTRVIEYTNTTATEFTGCQPNDFVSEEPLAGLIPRNERVLSERTDNSVELADEWCFQHWRFPLTYPRGTASGEVRIPPLTGLQVDVGVEVGYSVTATLDWRIDYLVPGTGWVGLCQGTEVGAPYDGEHVWFDIHFEPQDVDDIWLHRFRFGVRSRTFEAVSDFDDEGVPNPMATLVEYDGTTVTVDGAAFPVIPDISPVPLQEGKTYRFLNEDTPAILFMENGSSNVYYGKQQGVTKIWYSAPNPFAVNDLRAYTGDGVTPVSDIDSQDVSFKFRILSGAPDGDIDVFGNDYRNVVVANSATNLESGVDDLQNAFWLSKPNPSQFGVESLYFDLRDGNDATVVDHLLVDPVTPGVFFHIYYSNDPAPGGDIEEWEQLLWTRVDYTFQLRRRETLALPEPITAKYIKVEFTRLQPRYYSPGTLQEPTTYKKHPKWVLDYFLSLYEQQRTADFEYSDRIRLSYNAYDLAYSYYLDDLRTESPNAPLAVEGSEGNPLFNAFLRRENAAERERVDQATASKIRTTFSPFLRNPFLQGRFQDLLSVYARPTDLSNYSVESITEAVADTTEVTNLDRESLVVEKQFPVTSFYLTCRHFYRLSQAEFEDDRAYFVGLKEIAFTRDHYATKYDHSIYVENTGDNANILRNDFESVNQTWATYNDVS